MMMKTSIDELQENGFTILKKVFEKDVLHSLLSEIKSGELQSDSADNVPRLNKGSDILYSPFLKNKVFFDIFRHPTIEKILIACLNDEYYKSLGTSPNYILRSMICRSSKDELPWHIDSFIPFVSQYPSTVQVIIPLEPFTSKSGATLLYKSSHQFGEYSPQEHFDESPIVELHAEPGDVVIWDARIWHAAKQNESDGTRWAVISTFTRWWIKQNYRYTDELIRTKQISKYSDEDLVILGGASATPLNHEESIDLKGGIERIHTLRVKATS